MIRLFKELCKTLLEHLSDDNIYQDAADGYIHQNKSCPKCGAVGKLEPYGGYFRWLVTLRKRKTVDIRIWIRRFECASCGATHALLPDILMPYSMYSLHFKLTVLIAYFERSSTVMALCESFDIAVSTLYEWLKRLSSHKDLMIGVMMSRKTSAPGFLRALIDSDGLSDVLYRFFIKYGFSFMQGASVSAAQSVPP